MMLLQPVPRPRIQILVTPMHLEISHSLGQQEAIKRIDAWVEQVQATPLPAGVAITDLNRNWSSNVLTVSFRAKKGFFGATITGRATVHDNIVAIDIDLPAMLTALLSTAKIEEGIRNQVRPLLR